jgi:hypothetical protein
MAVRVCFPTHKIHLSISVYGSHSLFPYAQDPPLYLCLWQSEFVSLRTKSNSLSLSMAVTVCFPTHKIQLSIFVYGSQFVSLRTRSNSLSLSMAVSLFPYAQDPTLYLCLWQSEFVSLRTRSNSLSLSSNSDCHRQR